MAEAAPSPAAADPAGPTPSELSRGGIGATVGIALLLAAVSIALYARTLDYPFIPLDDDLYVSENPHLRTGLDPAHLGWVTRPYEANWIPLTWLSFAVDAEIGGLDPRVYHRTNIGLHAATSALLFIALQALTRSRWRSAIVAALFAVHPLHVESVAWVAERKDVLSGLFAVLTLWAYAGWTRAPSPARYAALLAAFALGLLAKPMLVTLPAVLLLLDFWPLGRLATPADRRHALLEKLPLFALSLVSAITTYHAQAAFGAMADLESVPFAQRLWNAVISVCVYVGQSVWPANLAIHYPYSSRAASLPLALAGTAGLTIFTAGVALQLRRRPHLAVGWLWFLGMLVPVLGLVQVGMQARADRYMYLPQIGLGLALVWSLPAPRALAPRARAGLVAGVAIALTALTWASDRQIRHWRSGIALFQHALEITGPAAPTHQALGRAFHELGRNEEALDHFRAASHEAPSWSHPYASAAAILLERGDHAGAHRLLSRAIETEPDSALIRLSFGRVLIESGQPKAALVHLRHALELAHPLYRAEVRRHMGFAQSELESWEHAIRHYRASLADEPDSALTWANLGFALQSQGESDAALEAYRRAISLDPDRAEVYGNAAVLLLERGQPEAALAMLDQAIVRGAATAEPHLTRYRIHLTAGRRAEAVAALRAALEAEPDRADVMNDLAWHLATESDVALQDPAEALRLAEEANRALAGREPAVLDTLAAALAANGRTRAALRTIEAGIVLAREQNRGDLVSELEQHRSEIAARSRAGAQ